MSEMSTTLLVRKEHGRLARPASAGPANWWFVLLGICLAASLGIVATAPNPIVGTAAAAAWLITPCVAFPVAVAKGSSALAHPWTIITGLLGHGWAIRLTLTTYDPNRATGIMLRGDPPGILYDGLLLGTIGLLCIAVGYAFSVARYEPKGADRRVARWSALDRKEAWPQGRLVFAAIVLVLASTIGLLLFVRSSGGFSVGKKFNNLESGAAGRAASASYFYLRLSYLGHTAFIILTVVRLKFGSLPGILSKFIYPQTILLAVLPPLLSDSRAGVGLVLVDFLIMQTVLTGRVRLARYAVLGVLAAILMGWMLALRSSGAFSVGRALSAIFQGRDLFDIGKTSHIAQLAGGVLHGQTLIGWLVFPLPSSLFPFGKPMWTGLGQHVWTNAYRGAGKNGVPAGLFGELYLNASWLGVVAGSIVFGVLIGTFQKWLKPNIENRQVIGAVLFALGVVRFTVFGLSNDFGTGVLSSLSDLLPVLVAIAFVAGPAWRGGDDPRRGGVRLTSKAALRASQVKDVRRVRGKRRSFVAPA